MMVVGNLKDFFAPFWSITLALAIALTSCGDTSEPDRLTQQPTKTKLAKIEGITSGQRLAVGDPVSFQVSTDDSGATVDSIAVSLAGAEINISGGQVTINTEALSVGKKTLKLGVTVNGEVEKYSYTLEFLSDIIPTPYSYERVAYYTHDPGAYTQGLFYLDGFLYENTGRKGESTLRKVDLETGSVLEKYFLADEYFGEGITYWEDKIIQLTWKANEGFVYRREGFEQLQSFNYPTEGWGITTLEEGLVMSDGTSTLYFLDPETLLETRRMEVYDDKGPVVDLNELEYIEGEIYANVFTTDDIVTIDPNTGKVLSRINLADLMNAKWGRPIDVLNGIAYDKARKRLFVTGKLWPRLYEIRLVEQATS